MKEGRVGGGSEVTMRILGAVLRTNLAWRMCRKGVLLFPEGF